MLFQHAFPNRRKNAKEENDIIDPWERIIMLFLSDSSCQISQKHACPTYYAVLCQDSSDIWSYKQLEQDEDEPGDSYSAAETYDQFSCPNVILEDQVASENDYYSSNPRQSDQNQNRYWC